MNKTIVMKRAWEIARSAVKSFGGKVKEYFAEALRQAWMSVRNYAEFQKVELTALCNRAKTIFNEMSVLACQNREIVATFAEMFGFGTCAKTWTNEQRAQLLDASMKNEAFASNKKFIDEKQEKLYSVEKMIKGRVIGNVKETIATYATV